VEPSGDTPPPRFAPTTAATRLGGAGWASGAWFERGAPVAGALRVRGEHPSHRL